MADDDRPPDTQTAAPPPVPPRRPRVGAAFPDADDWEQLRRDCAARGLQLQALGRQIEETQRQIRATLARIQAWEDRHREDEGLSR